MEADESNQMEEGVEMLLRFILIIYQVLLHACEALCRHYLGFFQ